MTGRPSEAKIAAGGRTDTAPAQPARHLGAAIEEMTKWLSENGVRRVLLITLTAALETLDANARAITDAIMRLRRL